jgi:tetratricopeptide (TPR) repeat protein
MLKVCCKCGRKADEGEKFRYVGLIGERSYYCAACWQKVIERNSLRVQILFGIVGLLGLALVLIEPQSAIGWILLNCFVLPILIWFSIVAHELGHAVMAWCCGMRVTSISFGSGTTVWSFRLGRLRIELNTILLNGSTLVLPPTIRWFRTKMFLLVAAGPAINLTVLGLLIIAGPNEILGSMIPGTKIAPMIDLFLANLFVLMIVLVPFQFAKYKSGAQYHVQSDGHKLLKIPSYGPEVAQTAHAGYFVSEATERHRDGDFKGAVRWYEQGLALYPEDFTTRFGLAFARLFLNQFANSREEWQSLLARKGLRPALRALLLNNIAWVDLMIGGRDYLEEADQFSQQALELQGSRPQFQGTRGSVLIELGEFDRGLPLVRAAFEFNTDPRLKALNACYLAIGEVRRGNVDAAMAHRDNARRLDANCQLLARVEDEIAGLPVHTKLPPAIPKSSRALIG